METIPSPSLPFHSSLTRSSPLHLFNSKDRLIDPTSLTSIYQITDQIGCLLLGLARKTTRPIHSSLPFPFLILSDPLL